LFSWVAGLVNSVTMSAVVFEPTTYMSGRMNDLLRDLVFDLPEGLLVACILYCFVMGGAAAAWLVSRVGSIKTFLLSAAPLALGTALVWTAGGPGNEDVYTALRYGVAALMSFATGVLNGATSQNKIGRTTHVTGDLTDLGVAIARADWWRATYLFFKQVGFALGGLIGFLAVRTWAPATVLMVAVLAVTLSALALGYLEDRLVERQAPADPLRVADATG
jgi:uncharacterized membrane protein YoaK (UPF0700 family)